MLACFCKKHSLLNILARLTLRCVETREPHIKEIYRRLHAELPETKLIFMLPFLIDTVQEKLPFHKVLDEYRALLKDIATQNGADIIDLQAMFNKAQQTIEPCKLAVDGVHPTNLGHQLIAQEVLKRLTF